MYDCDIHNITHTHVHIIFFYYYYYKLYCNNSEKLAKYLFKKHNYLKLVLGYKLIS